MGSIAFKNIMTVLRVFSYVFIASIGMTMIIITGNIDISFGAVVSAIAITMAAVSKIDTSYRHIAVFTCRNDRRCAVMRYQRVAYDQV